MSEPLYKDKLPSRNPDPERFPTPWRIEPKGNGIMAVYCAQGKLLVQAFCWSGAECDKLIEQVNQINEG